MVLHISFSTGKLDKRPARTAVLDQDVDKGMVNLSHIIVFTLSCCRVLLAGIQ